MRIVVFEDDAAYKFEPLTLTRGVFDLRLGLFSFADRVKHYMQVEQVDFLARNHIAEHIRVKRRVRANEPEAIDDETVFVNGLLVFDRELRRIAQRIRPETVVLKDDRIVLARFSEAVAREVARLLMNAPGSESVKTVIGKGFEKTEYVGDALLTNPWEIVQRNPLQMIDDYETMPRLRLRIPPEATVIGRRRNVYVGRDTQVDPYVTLNSERGPIYIGEACEIRVGSFIEGPAYIGPGTIVHPSSIVSGSNIGPACRIGGEVESTVIHGYVDKRHAGFLGHAYVGEWVELGALFTNADRSMHGSVRVTARGVGIDTGLTEFGGIIADYAKASAGSLLYAGRRIGVASQVYGAVWEDVPSFVLYAKNYGLPASEIEVDEVLRAARRTAALREVEFTPADEQLLRRVFELTREERGALEPRREPFRLD
jgi:UDP-N-acetylglucosamine diphosphorylase/glucosamine-1-phosphate N-acetyltransferase